MKKNAESKIAIIGHFGADRDLLDGQTVKTKILYQELTAATGWQIRTVDTYYKSTRPLRLLAQTVSCLLRSRDILVLLSGNGMRFYFPLLSFCARVFHTRVYHDVIGGSLDRYVERYPRFRRYLNSFRVNWVETEGLKLRLEAIDIRNCEVLPNFKRLSIAAVPKASFCEPYRFCTFSRVMKEKGIEDAVSAVEEINREAGRTVCTLDIYGSVDASYRARFERVLADASSAIHYGGLVPYDRSVRAIQNYDALLFPTRWDGEGFPGTIVDAFSAGLPVIASDWGCNGEIIRHKQNGLLYPNAEMPELKDAIQWLLRHPADVFTMREACLRDARLYQPDLYIQKIITKLESR